MAALTPTLLLFVHVCLILYIYVYVYICHYCFLFLFIATFWPITDNFVESCQKKKKGEDEAYQRERRGTDSVLDTLSSLRYLFPSLWIFFLSSMFLFKNILYIKPNWFFLPQNLFCSLSWFWNVFFFLICYVVIFYPPLISSLFSRTQIKLHQIVFISLYLTILAWFPSPPCVESTLY